MITIGTKVAKTIDLKGFWVTTFDVNKKSIRFV